jgi:two-component system response regulator PilR (NtrC family)
MESELFGHKRGSFTGAVADNPGLIRNAEGGTLFLDEVAELPLHMQVKLLRVIQEKTVRGVGEQREVPIDVRILSATHKKLAEQVAAGRFREDLYYRINVIEVPVPALREHREDMDELVNTILRRQARKLGIAAPEVTDEARSALRSHPFPGNVRELENVLERALALHPDGAIGVSALQLRQLAQPDAAVPVRELGGTTTAPAGKSGEALGAQLEQLEREAIMRALEQTRFNKTAAAKLLGMSFRALRYKVKKLGID